MHTAAFLALNLLGLGIAAWKCKPPEQQPAQPFEARRVSEARAAARASGIFGTLPLEEGEEDEKGDESEESHIPPWLLRHVEGAEGAEGVEGRWHKPPPLLSCHEPEPQTRALPPSLPPPEHPAYVVGTGAAFGHHYSTEQMLAAFHAQVRS